MVELTRTAHYAWLEPNVQVPSAASEAYIQAIEAWRAKMDEVQRLEIPVLLFIGSRHREAVASYTRHLEHGLYAAIAAEPNQFATQSQEAADHHGVVMGAVRADFEIS